VGKLGGLGRGVDVVGHRLAGVAVDDFDATGREVSHDLSNQAQKTALLNSSMVSRKFE
jgi:hypothetical protein